MIMKELTIDSNQQLKFDKLIKKLSKKHKVKGTSVILVNKDSVLYKKHYGIINAQKVKNNATRKMMIGSTTKLLTALAILILKDKESIDLDEPITTYIPEIAINHRFDKEPIITPRMLLMHISGLPSDNFDLITRKDKSLADIPELIKDSYLCARPNTMPAYSNLSYGLLGLIIERVTKQSYAEYIHKNIVEKLGLSIEFITNRQQLKEREKAISQSFTAKGKVKEDPLGTIVSGGSSTYATIDDLGKFLQFFLNHEHQKLLNPKTMQSMLQKPEASWIVEGELTVGLGLMHDIRHFNNTEIGPIKGHGGNTIYHHSTFEFLPDENFGIAVMTNSEKGALVAKELTVDIMRSCLESLGYEIPKRLFPQPSTTKSDQAFNNQDFVGAGLKISSIKNKDNQSIYRFSGLKFKLDSNSDGYFNAQPLGVSRLPILNRLIKNIRFKPMLRDEETILYLEQSEAYFKRVFPLFGSYQKADVYDSWESACKNYRIINNNPALNQLFESAKLKRKNDDLIIEMKLLGSKNKYYLYPINDKEAIIQGFGRGTKETITLNSDHDHYYLSLQGIELKSIE